MAVRAKSEHTALNAAHRVRASRSKQSQSTGPEALLELQHMAGNEAIRSLLAPPGGGSPPPMSPSDLSKDSGERIDPETLGLMETRFGEDFSDVRIHTSAQAAESARSMNANAYAIGRDIVFESGQYSPETRHGRTLLAHELAHVVQQRRGGPARPSLSASSSLEVAAESAASAIVNTSGPVVVAGASAPGIARDEKKAAAEAAAAVDPPKLAKALQNMATDVAEDAVLSPLLLEILTSEPSAEVKAYQAEQRLYEQRMRRLHEIAEATGQDGKLKVSLDELIEDASKKFREEQLVEEILEASKNKKLAEKFAEAETKEKLTQAAENAVAQTLEKSDLPKVTAQMAHEAAAKPSLAAVAQQVVQYTPQAPRTPLDIPAEGIEMPWVGNGAGVSSSELGYLRDSKYYWQEYLKKWPDQMSPANAARIKKGLAPIVDAEWLKFHPQHAAYAGQVLEHHHLGQGALAVPLPEKLHDAYTVFHPQRQVIGEPGKPMKPMKPRPTTQRTQAELARHTKAGRIAGPGIDPKNPPKPPKIPRASALAGVPEKDLKPVKPDTGIDPNTGIATKQPPKPKPQPDAAAPAAKQVQAKAGAVADQPASGAVAKQQPAPPPPGSAKETLKETEELAPKASGTKPLSKEAEKELAELAEKKARKELLEKSEGELSEIVAEGAANKAFKKTPEALADTAVGALKSSAMGKLTAKKGASLAPLIGWYFSLEDVGKGLDDLAHGHIYTGANAITMATVDMAADALHLADPVTAGGGTGASLVVQGFTIDQQIRNEQRRVEERGKELRAYIKEHGSLPPDKELMEYYGLNDEEVMILRNDVSGYNPIRGLIDVPADERDGYVVEQALKRAENPPQEKDGLPDVASESLTQHIRERMNELDTAIKEATGDDAKKLQARRDAFASLLPGLEPHIEHEKKVRAERERKEKIRQYNEWKKKDDARKAAEADAAKKKDTQPKQQQAQPPALLPDLKPAADPVSQAFPGLGPMMKDPEQKFAEEFVTNSGHWGRRLSGDAKKLLDRIHSDHPPTDAEKSTFLSEETSWRKTVTDWADRFEKQGRSSAASGLRELLATRGEKLLEYRTYLGG